MQESARRTLEVLRRWSARARRPGSSDAAPFVPAGHFYSPIPSLDEVRQREDRIWGYEPSLPGIDLRADEQLALVEQFRRFYADQPFPEKPGPDTRYWFDNDWFGHGDAIVLHCMLRHLRPRRVIEVGSGFSSAVMLDTNERFLDNRMACTFVDPYPERLLSVLRDGDRERIEIVGQPVQDLDLERFRALEAGDVLFIDSSHVSKVGSDVNRLVFEVLPTLAPGVVVHVHDILYPFEYFKEWVYEGRAWNESYLLRAFLMFNDEFRILFFNSYLRHFHAERVSDALPVWKTNPGGSIWLRRQGLPAV